MKGAIASVEVYGFRGDDPVKRFTLTLSAPTRDPLAGHWECRVVLANVQKPAAVAAPDSVEALQKAIEVGGRWVAELRQQGYTLYRDRAGTAPFEGL